MNLEKPPLPSSSLWDCLRIPTQFYVEWIFGYLALVAFTLFLEKRIGPGAYITLLILGVAMSLVALLRMVRKVIALRNAKGPMRGNGLLAFWVLLLFPMIGAAVSFRLVGTRSEFQTRQLEAKIALGTIAESEQKFKQDFGTYSLSMRELSYEPEEDGMHYYMLGFPAACAVKAGLSEQRSQWGVSNAPLTEARRLEIIEFFQKVKNAEDCKDPKLGFELYAVGVIKENAPLDVWRIDEAGRLENLQRGL